MSIKLSALHPRYEPAQRDRVLAELLPRLRHLALAARAGGIALVIDAEEVDQLELQLELFGRLAAEPALIGWNGLGLVVQAYLKCAPELCDLAIECARATGRRIPVRLVKGAYWDSEIKHAQTLGLPDYPVFTRKAATDLSYLVCAERLLAAPREIFSAFATHNCHTVAAIRQLARAAGGPDYEFQKLQGMGDALYRTLREEAHQAPVRIYGPVGDHRDLLAYLVRRLLENGANSSFVHQIADPKVPLARLVSNPVAQLPMPYATNPRVPLPGDLFPDRRNSEGIDLADVSVLDSIARAIALDRDRARSDHGSVPQRSEPGNLDALVGSVADTPTAALDDAIARAQAAFPEWTRRSVEDRARILKQAADALEASRLGFVSLLAREAGKTFDDGVAEVREAVDFCRYYATEARHRFTPQALPGPTGESNRLSLHGRGVFACISPWNFPAGDLHRPGRCRPRCRQHGCRQAGRADAARRAPDGRNPARGGRAGRCAGARDRHGRDDRRAARRRSAHRGRGIHRLGRYGAAHQPRARGARRGDRAAHRRDRRSQRDGRRLHRARRAGRP